MLYPLKFKPVYKDYLWGGQNLKEFNKKEMPPITAESWEISANKDGMSVIENGQLAGTTLENVFRWFPKQLCGTGSFNKFPLLIKLIDACQPLSVQVHPDDIYAFEKEGGEFGKNEMWYILDAKPGAQLIYGLKQGVTKRMFTDAIENGRIETTLNYVDVKKGDSFYIPAGLVHAIGEGIVICEVQQNSNLTYRVYDYDRIGKDGKKRPLHLEKALDVIDFSEKTKNQGGIVTFGGIDYLAYSKYFAVELIQSETVYESDTAESVFHAYTVIEGSFEVSKVIVEKGESVLVPADTGIYDLEGSFTAIKSFVPDISRRFVC